MLIWRVHAIQDEKCMDDQELIREMRKSCELSIMNLSVSVLSRQYF